MRKITIPGDKSITQRFLILGALAHGKSYLRGALSSADCISTATSLESLGVGMEAFWTNGEVAIQGVGLQGICPTAHELDFQNSGTGARLMLGVLSAQKQSKGIIVTGDNSLKSRPMDRIVDPLTVAGGQLEYLESVGRLPISVTGKSLRPIRHHSPIASAQVKSALIFASLVSRRPVTLSEPIQSRDHTERMLSGMGVNVTAKKNDDCWEIKIDNPPCSLDPFEIDIPGDFSSAAFFIGLAVLGGVQDGLAIENVGLNSTRTGLLNVLCRMGARIRIEETNGKHLGESRGFLEISASELSGTQVHAEEVPAMIDEFPILAVIASRATGVTSIRGAKELRLKESDRIQAIVQNMRAIGVEIEEFEDGLEILGTEKPLIGEVRSQGDHRVAMAFGILSSLPKNKIEIVGMDAADVSFPGFWKILSRLRSDSRSDD